VDATPLLTKPKIIQIRPNWYNQKEHVVSTPSFNCLVEAVTDDELSKLNTLDLEDSSSNVNKSFKPLKVMPILLDLAATIGRQKSLNVGWIFSACAQVIINTNTYDSNDNHGIPWEVLNSSEKVEVGSSTGQACPHLPTLQFLWTFLKGINQSTPYAAMDLMRICAAPKVVNKLSRAKRCFLSDSLGLAADNLPLPHYLLLT